MENISQDQVIRNYKQEIEEYWTKDCSFYDNYPEHGLTKKEEELWEEFLHTEIGNKPLKILDVGTGTGSISLILSKLGHDVTGIDLSPGMLSVCERKAGERGLTLDLHVGDAEALPFPDNNFDMITSRWVLWTLLQPEIAINEWKRVIKPGGKILAFDVKTHDFGNITMMNKFRQFISKKLISIQDGRKPDSYSYKQEITDSLPLSYRTPDCFDKQVLLFKNADLREILVKMVEPLTVMQHEKLDKPWRYKIGRRKYGDWHCISGKKTE
ncbi:class I SAM-dependent methyltransferase [Methanospirillum sp.]|jgi:ubiquinone/menaquinone biosynthesis C-methylase UbiE